jgi:hypothetical protein
MHSRTWGVIAQLGRPLIAAVLVLLWTTATASAAGPRLTVSSGVGAGKLAVTIKATGATGWSATLERKSGKRWIGVGARKVPRSGRLVLTVAAPSTAQTFRVRLRRNGRKPVVSRVLKIAARPSGLGRLPSGGGPVSGASGPPSIGPGGAPSPTPSGPTAPTTPTTPTTPTLNGPPPPVVVPATQVASAPVPPDDGTAPPATGRLVLSGERTDLKAGDTIAVGVGAATPYGFLGQVTGTTISNGQTVVQTASTTLVDALDSGSFDTSFDAVPQPEALRGLQRSSNRSLTQPVSRKVTCAATGSVKLEGSLSITPHFAFSAQWSLLHLIDAAKFTGSVTASASLTGSASAASNCTLKPTPLLAKPITFSPVEVQVGPIPVVLVPRLQIYMLANGEISANLTTGITASVTGTAGVSYQRGSGFAPISGLTASFDYTPPTLDSDAHLEAGLRPRLDLLLYGIAGPDLTITGSLAFDANSSKDPWWTLKGIVSAGAGLTVPVLSLDWGKDDIFTKQVTLAEAADAPPVPMLSVDGPKLDVENDGLNEPLARVMLQAGHPFAVVSDAGGYVNVTDVHGASVPTSNSNGNGLIVVEPIESGLAFISLTSSGSHPSLWATSVHDHGSTAIPLDQEPLVLDRPGRVERYEVPLAKDDEVDFAIDTGSACMSAHMSDGASIYTSCGSSRSGVGYAPRSGVATVDVFISDGHTDAESLLSLSRPVTVTTPVGADGLHVTTAVPGQRAIVHATGALGPVGVAALDSSEENIAVDGVSAPWVYGGGGIKDRYMRFLAPDTTFDIGVQAASADPVDTTLWLSADVVHEVTLPASKVAVTHTRPGQAQVLRFTAAQNDAVNVAVTDLDGEDGLPYYVPGFEDLGSTASCAFCAQPSEWLQRVTTSHSGAWQAVLQLADRSTGTAHVSLSQDLEASTAIDADQISVTTTVPGQRAHLTFAPSSNIVSVDQIGLGASLTMNANMFWPAAGSFWQLPSDQPTVDAWLDGGTNPFTVKLRILSPHLDDVAAPTSASGATRSYTIDAPRRIVGSRFTPVVGETYTFADVDGDGPQGRPNGSTAFVDNSGQLLSTNVYVPNDTRQITAVFLPSDRRTGTVSLKLARQ